MSLRHVTVAPATFEEFYLALFRDCFPETGGTPLETPEHYRWKYSPAGKVRSACEYASYEGSQLIGYYAALPFRFQIGQHSTVGGLVCDVMTHSSGRGKGVFTALGRHATTAMANDGIDFVIGYPIRHFVIPGHLKVGWRIAFPLPVYVQILDPTAALAQRGLKWLSPAVRAMCSAFRRGAGMLQPAGRAVVTRADAPDLFASAEYEAFYSEWSREHANYMHRAGDFWQWRLSAPQTRYTVLTGRVDGKLVGVAVARQTTVHGLPVFAVAELMWLRDNARDIRPMYAALETEAKRSGAASVAMMCTAETASRLRLRANGYVKSPVEFKLILKWLSRQPQPDKFFDMTSWHLTWLDTDTL